MTGLVTLVVQPVLPGVFSPNTHILKGDFPSPGDHHMVDVGVAGVIGSFFTVVEVAKIILCSHGSTSFLSTLKSIRVYGLISQGFWPPSLQRQRRGADSHRIHPATY